MKLYKKHKETSKIYNILLENEFLCFRRYVYNFTEIIGKFAAMQILLSENSGTDSGSIC